MKMRTAFYAGLLYAEKDTPFSSKDALPDGTYVYVNDGNIRWIKYHGGVTLVAPEDVPKDLLMLVMLME